jgi:hypothetical protein
VISENQRWSQQTRVHPPGSYFLSTSSCVVFTWISLFEQNTYGVCMICVSPARMSHSGNRPATIRRIFNWLRRIPLTHSFFHFIRHYQSWRIERGVCAVIIKGCVFSAPPPPLIRWKYLVERERLRHLFLPRAPVDSFRKEAPRGIKPVDYFNSSRRRTPLCTRQSVLSLFYTTPWFFMWFRVGFEWRPCAFCSWRHWKISACHRFADDFPFWCLIYEHEWIVKAISSAVVSHMC